MHRALALSGNYLCIRAAKCAESMTPLGWEHDALCVGNTIQLTSAYRSLTRLLAPSQDAVARCISEFDGDLIHVHNEPNWPVAVAKANSTLPVVLNVHDLSIARPTTEFDPFEEEAFALADAFVFVNEYQRAFAIQAGYAVEGKPHVCIGNYLSTEHMVDKPVLPHVGGVVYAGGIDMRGATQGWRDMSAVSDALSGALHIYTDSSCDYGKLHMTEYDFDLYLQRLATHDWGFCGTPNPMPAWEHSIPNKFYDYIAAGIPVIAMNVPLVRDACEKDGLGVYVERPSDIPRAIAMSKRAPFVKRVLAARRRLSWQAHVAPVAAMFDSLVKP
jgi:hypothetical protein